MEKGQSGRIRQDPRGRLHRPRIRIHRRDGDMRVKQPLGAIMNKVTDFCIKFTIGGLGIIAFVALTGLAAIADGI
jgi:hypothetical protein